MADYKLSVCEIVSGESRGNEERGRERESLGSPEEVTTPNHLSVLPSDYTPSHLFFHPLIFSSIHSLLTHSLPTIHPLITL